MKLKHVMGFLAAALFSVGANATVILQDNFDAEAGAPGVSVLNYNSFANWTVSNGTVDVVANTNGWGISCVGGTGKCVDLDGSTGNAGVLTSSLLSLAAGNYTFSFDISGNQRGYSPDSMTMTLGGFLSQAFTLSSSDPWATKTYNFTVSSATSDYIVFNHTGGDNVGIMLDNVSLVMTSKVPEPSSLVLVGLGLLSLGFVRRKSVK